MEDRLATMIVNETQQHDLVMKIGNPDIFFPLAVVEEGCEYNVGYRVNWTYQEFPLEEEHGDSAAKKLSVTFDNHCTNILRGDSKLASAALKLARHVRTRKGRGGADELLGLVLELVDFAQSACESPLIGPATTHTWSDFQDPRRYADSLVFLARDVDAHPWGAFRFVHPAEYLPFLQQLAEDLIG